MEKAKQRQIEYCEDCRGLPVVEARVGRRIIMRAADFGGDESRGLSTLLDFGLGAINDTHCGVCGAPLQELAPGHCQECRRLIVPIIKKKNDWYDLSLPRDFPRKSIGSEDREYLLGWKTGMRGLRNKHICFCDVGPLLRELDQLFAKETPLMKFLHGLINGLHESD